MRLMTNIGEVEEIRFDGLLFAEHLENVFFKVRLNDDRSDIIVRFEDVTDIAWFNSSQILEWLRRAKEFAKNSATFETVNGLEAWID